MLTATIECPRCSKPANFQFQEICEFGEIPYYDEDRLKKIGNALGIIDKPAASAPKETPTGNETFDEIINVAGTAFCPICAQPVYFSFTMPRLHFINHLKSLKEPTKRPKNRDLAGCIFEVLPTPPTATTDKSWPKEIRREFEDAQRLLRQDMSPSIIISTCRTVLDVSVKKLGGEGRNIFDRINDLQTKGVITQPIAEWSHDIRKFGADATHDAEGTTEDATAFVEFLKVMLNIAFTLPEKIKSRRTS